MFDLEVRQHPHQLLRCHESAASRMSVSTACRVVGTFSAIPAGSGTTKYPKLLEPCTAWHLHAHHVPMVVPGRQELIDFEVVKTWYRRRLARQCKDSSGQALLSAIVILFIAFLHKLQPSKRVLASCCVASVLDAWLPQSASCLDASRTSCVFQGRNCAALCDLDNRSMSCLCMI